MEDMAGMKAGANETGRSIHRPRNYMAHYPYTDLEFPLPIA